MGGSVQLEKSLLGLAGGSISPQQFASGLSKAYGTFALTAVPPPALAGNQDRMNQAVFSAFASPAGNPGAAANGIVQGVAAFWLGAVLVTPGGVITAFLGGPALYATLLNGFTNHRATPGQVASFLARALTTATNQVQYFIPPMVTGFLVVT